MRGVRYRMTSYLASCKAARVYRLCTYDSEYLTYVTTTNKFTIAPKASCPGKLDSYGNGDRRAVAGSYTTLWITITGPTTTNNRSPHRVLLSVQCLVLVRLESASSLRHNVKETRTSAKRQQCLLTGYIYA